MITDSLKNIDKYPQIPDYIKDFIKNTPTECGRYKIKSEDYANIETYTTKPIENCRFESHKKYADIQFLLSGTERIDYTSDKLEPETAYDQTKDIEFFKYSKPTSSVYLDGSNFVVFMPHELHCPQMNFADNSQEVKKVVVKITSFE